MKTRPFHTLIAATYGVEEKSLAVLVRLLRENGYITTGSRGLSSPDMTEVDAARVTIALLGGGGDSPARGYREFLTLRDFRVSNYWERSKQQIEDFDKLLISEMASFEEFLTALFLAYVRASKDETLWISYEARQSAISVNLRGQKYFFVDLDAENREIATADALDPDAIEGLSGQEVSERIAARMGALSTRFPRVAANGIRIIRQITNSEVAKISTSMFPKSESGSE